MERTLFEHAAVRYQNMVYRIALHYFGNSQDAEDAVQEVFLRLYTAEKSFKSRSLTSRSRRRCIGRLWRCRRNTEQC